MSYAVQKSEVVSYTQPWKKQPEDETRTRQSQHEAKEIQTRAQILNKMEAGTNFRIGVQTKVRAEEPSFPKAMDTYTTKENPRPRPDKVRKENANEWPKDQSDS